MNSTAWRQRLRVAIVACAVFTIFIQAVEARPVPVRLRIRCLKAAVFVGDEVPIEFKVTNVSTELFEYSARSYDRSGRMSEYQLRVVGPEGNPLPDPEATRTGVVGGLATRGQLAPKKSFATTIPLNLWARVGAPGRYTVVGIYHTEQKQRADSPAITIKVKARTPAQMRAHVATLLKQLARLPLSADATRVISRLAYTDQPEVITPVLTALYRPNLLNGSFAVGYYFPQYFSKELLKDKTLKLARERGLATGMGGLLEIFGASQEERVPLVLQALDPGSPATWAEGCLAAQSVPDDQLINRAAEIALTAPPTVETSGPRHSDPAAAERWMTRQRCIDALATHRTDASVAALRRLLKDEDPLISRTAKLAIDQANYGSSVTSATPFKQEDFKN